MVRLLLRHRDGRAVERMRVGLDDVPAAQVLDALLRRALLERRRGRTLEVESAPDDLLALLELCGLLAPDGPIRR